jgi:hypothetical protein
MKLSKWIYISRTAQCTTCEDSVMQYYCDLLRLPGARLIRIRFCCARRPLTF